MASRLIETCPHCGKPLDGKFNSSTYPAFTSLRFTPSQRVLLDTLLPYIGQWIANSVILDKLYGHRSDGGPLNARGTLRSLVFQSNQRLEGTGYKIESQSGKGGDDDTYRRLILVEI